MFPAQLQGPSQPGFGVLCSVQTRMPLERSGKRGGSPTRQDLWSNTVVSVTRTVVCNDPDMTLPPASVPPDTSRLRLERTAIRRVPGESFKVLSRLEQLWLPYNALCELSALMLKGLRRLRELRMPGNRLATFPWAALRDAPQRRLLDLQANRLSAVPPEAARFLGNLTFLDLSSNQLLRLPQELLVTWAHLQTGPFLPGHHARLVLGKRWHPSLRTTLVKPCGLRQVY